MSGTVVPRRSPATDVGRPVAESTVISGGAPLARSGAPEGTNMGTNGRLIPENVREEAIRAARLIGDRLACHGAVREAYESGQVQGEPTSVATGYPGIAIFYHALNAVDANRGWGKYTRLYAQMAVAETAKKPITDVSLFSGGAGIGYALDLIRGEHPALGRAADKIRDKCIAASDHAESWKSDAQIQALDYDLVQGSTGLLTYFVSLTHQTPESRRVTRQLIQRLANLCHIVGDAPAGATIYPTAEAREAHYISRMLPDGYLDLGVAHGLPGVIAALSLAMSNGNSIPQLRESITGVAEWVASLSRTDARGDASWPLAVSRSETTTHAGLARHTWCYGTAGVSRSIALSAKAIGRDDLLGLASSALETTITTGPHMRRPTAPQLCHGLAGLAMAILHTVVEGAMAPTIALAALTEEILASCTADASFGVRCEIDTGTYGDDPALLNGAAGVGLTLLSLVTLSPGSWSRLLLLG